MIDKSLVKKRFKRSLKTYDENAIVQKQMASKLVDFLPCKKFNSVLEVGCATGILTREMAQNVECTKYTSNDIVEESVKYVKEIIPECEFIAGDIEELNLNEKYDLIISNACLQWCSDIENTFKKLFDALNDNGIIAISIFGDENLKEIKSSFDIENKTYSMTSLKYFFSEYNVLLNKEETIKMSFSSPVEVLKHIKLTGVNALKELKLTKTDLKNFERDYSKKYSENGSVYLTYNPVYILCQKL